jgi:hypothetical protein
MWALRLILTVAAAWAAVAGEVPRGACAGIAEPRLVAELGAHVLWLCGGAQPQSFPIAIGRGGTGKQREHDGKTPVGEYPLGEPRPSAKFHVFIPIRYPTPTQLSQGFTGGDIGIHGPPRYLGPLAGASLWFDWTAGCLALGSDAQVERVASWVRENHPRSITLRER